ncbi:MAG: hypothetical protein WCB61_17480 [Pseudolabrys sp.]
MTDFPMMKSAAKSSAFSNDYFDVRDGDFQRELNKAVANNWITIDLRNRYRYQLTATGYAVRRMIDPALGQATNFVRP